MDPVLVAGIQFLLAILSGAFVALLAQQFASRSAAEQQRRAIDERDGAMRRALAAEIRENMRRLGGPVVSQVPSARIVRVAWDAARALPLEDDVFDAIAVAYMHGAELEQWVDLILGRVRIRGVVATWSSEHRARKDSIAKALERAQATYDSFAAALKVVGRQPYPPREAAH
jgi:hypothetical protein